MNLKNIFKYMDVVVGFSLDWMGKGRGNVFIKIRSFHLQNTFSKFGWLICNNCLCISHFIYSTTDYKTVNIFFLQIKRLLHVS